MKKEKKIIKEEIEKKIEELSYKFSYIIYRWKQDLICGKEIDFVTPLESLLTDLDKKIKR